MTSPPDDVWIDEEWTDAGWGHWPSMMRRRRAASKTVDVSFFHWATTVVAEGGTLESGEVELLAAEAQKLWAENVELRRQVRSLSR